MWMELQDKIAWRSRVVGLAATQEENSSRANVMTFSIHITVQSTTDPWIGVSKIITCFIGVEMNTMSNDGRRLWHMFVHSHLKALTCLSHSHDTEIAYMSCSNIQIRKRLVILRWFCTHIWLVVAISVATLMSSGRSKLIICSYNATWTNDLAKVGSGFWCLLSDSSVLMRVISFRILLYTR